jgi:uncharacterized membrane protein
MEKYNAFMTAFLTAVSILAGATIAGYLTALLEFYKDKELIGSSNSDPVMKQKSRLLCLLRWSSLLYIGVLIATINFTLAYINKIEKLQHHLDGILIFFAIAIGLTLFILLPPETMKLMNKNKRISNVREIIEIIFFVVAVVGIIVYVIWTNCSWYPKVS